MVVHCTVCVSTSFVLKNNWTTICTCNHDHSDTPNDCTCTCMDDRDGWFGRRFMKVHVHVAIWYMEAKYIITTIQL